MMAVNWNWNKKIGVATMLNHDGKKNKLNIYEANCLGALIYEFKDENGKAMYQFYGFWNDIKHLKNCLGLSREYKNNLYKGVMLKIKLNTFYKDSVKMAGLFAKANIKVELYYKEIK
jgi:hypothetical protein